MGEQKQPERNLSNKAIIYKILKLPTYLPITTSERNRIKTMIDINGWIFIYLVCNNKIKEYEG